MNPIEGNGLARAPYTDERFPFPCNCCSLTRISGRHEKSITAVKGRYTEAGITADVYTQALVNPLVERIARMRK